MLTSSRTTFIVKDTLHGVLTFEDSDARDKREHVIRKIIDSAPMQRLREIKQCAFVDLVYPGASHTRFVHSLGVAYIAGELARIMGLDRNTILLAQITGLLHDIGSYPFVHIIEEQLIRQEEGGLPTHEELAEQAICGSEIGACLEERGIDPINIANYVRFMGKAEGGLIGSIVYCADKIDSTMRDALFAHVKVEVDPYLLHVFKAQGNRLVLRKKGIPAVCGLIRARFRLTQTVYRHHCVRSACCMLGYAIRTYEAEIGHDIALNRLPTMTDYELINTLLARESTKTLIAALKRRRLYKRLIEIFPHDFGVAATRLVPCFPSRRHVIDFENQLIEELQTRVKNTDGLPPVLVDVTLAEALRMPERLMHLEVETGQTLINEPTARRIIWAIRDAYAQVYNIRVYIHPDLYANEEKKIQIRDVVISRLLEKLRVSEDSLKRIADMILY